MHSPITTTGFMPSNPPLGNDTDGADQERARLIECGKAIQAAIAEGGVRVWQYRLAFGNVLRALRDEHVAARDWGRFVKAEFSIGRTYAHYLIGLANQRPLIVQRVEQSGGRLPLRAALRLAGLLPPKAPRPSQPKTLSEIEDPATLGAFLEQKPERLFKALVHAPTVKTQIERALTAKPDPRADDAITEIARAGLAGLTNASAANVDAARKQFSQILKLSNPSGIKPHLKPLPSQRKLDADLLPKALGLLEAA